MEGVQTEGFYPSLPRVKKKQDGRQGGPLLPAGLHLVSSSAKKQGEPAKFGFEGHLWWLAVTFGG